MIDRDNIALAHAAVAVEVNSGSTLNVIPASSHKRWRLVAEKRRIVELTLQPDARVSQVAQAEGVNANQVFQWRRAYHNGEMQAVGCTALLAVVRGAEAR